MNAADLRDTLADIVRANEYMTLATADATGHPWASPVWFATADLREFLWVSSPDARHSRNLAVRPQVAIAVFDSRQPPGTGRGAYLSATGAPVPPSELDDAVALYSAASQRASAPALSRAEVEPPARLRLYRATVTERFVLTDGDRRAAVP